MSEVGIAGIGPRVDMLARLCQRNGHNAWVWPERPEDAERLQETGAMLVDKPQELAQRARLIFVAVPSWRLVEVAHQLGDSLQGSHRLVHTVHGLDVETGLRPSEILRRETPVRQVAALLGTVQAPDHLDSQPGAALISSRFPSLIQEVQGLVASSMFRVYGNRDLVGSEIAAAAANVIALAVGLLGGLSFGPAARGLLMARAVAEISRLAEAAGGESRTGSGMAGLGLLVAQTTEPGGVECAIGRALAAGRPLDELKAAYGGSLRELEATSTILLRQAQNHGRAAHITEAVQKVLAGELSVPESVRELLTLHQMME